MDTVPSSSVIRAPVSPIRGGRVQAEFRWCPSSARDDLVRAMGNKVKVHELLGGSTNTVNFNCEENPSMTPGSAGP